MESKILVAQPAEVFYIMLSGTVKVCVEQSDGSEVIVAICGFGSVLGEMSSVEGIGHPRSVITLEPSVCLWSGRLMFLDILQIMPAVSFNLTQNTMRRLRLATDHIRSLANQDVPRRVASQLLVFAREYGKPLPCGATLIPFRLTQSDLADGAEAVPNADVFLCQII
jgi:CRP/FNR family cyclic AMP-dependent transcriptional regulator